ncbi:MAG TPA: hypothetical protein VEU32_16790 [Burkholderiales bacterium]|nr:hypothetical protein [Burkholderiales bacterium]
MRVVLLLVAVAALGLSACGEKEQVVVYKQGKYQGKPDNQSWSNDPLPAEYRGGTWTKGDRSSWEESIKKRQMTQNEYRRIGQ